MLYLPQSLKRCSKCGEWRGNSSLLFLIVNKQKRCKGWRGLDNVCRQCRSTQNKQYREKNRASYTSYKQEYYRKNKAHILQASRRYRNSNNDAVCSRSRLRWQQYSKTLRGLLSIAVSARNRKARKCAAQGSHTSADIRRQYEKQGGKCFYCSVEVGNKYHVDHVMPLSRGGTNNPENLVIACPTCNLRKNKKTAEEFLALLLAEKNGGDS